MSIFRFDRWGNLIKPLREKNIKSAKYKKFCPLIIHKALFLRKYFTRFNIKSDFAIMLATSMDVF